MRCRGIPPRSRGGGCQQQSRIRNEDTDAYCPDCREELANPDDRRTLFEYEIDSQENTLEFTVGVENNTNSSIGLNFTDSLQVTVNDTDTSVSPFATLEVINEDGENVFEHIFLRERFHRDGGRIMTHDWGSGMNVSRNQTITRNVTWGKLDDELERRLIDFLAAPDTKPCDHEELKCKITFHFDNENLEQVIEETIPVPEYLISLD